MPARNKKEDLIVGFTEDNEKELDDHPLLDLYNVVLSVFHDQAILPHNDRAIINRIWNKTGLKSLRQTVLFTDDPGDLIEEEGEETKDKTDVVEEAAKNESDDAVSDGQKPQEWSHGIRTVSPLIITPAPLWWERVSEVVTFVPPTPETNIEETVRETLGEEFPHAIGKQVEMLMADHWEEMHKKGQVEQIEDHRSQFNSTVAKAQVNLSRLLPAYFKRRLNSTEHDIEVKLQQMKEAAREVMGRHYSDIESDSSDESSDTPKHSQVILFKPGQSVPGPSRRRKSTFNRRALTSSDSETSMSTESSSTVSDEESPLERTNSSQASRKRTASVRRNKVVEMDTHDSDFDETNPSSCEPAPTSEALNRSVRKKGTTRATRSRGTYRGSYLHDYDSSSGQSSIEHSSDSDFNVRKYHLMKSMPRKRTIKSNTRRRGKRTLQQRKIEGQESSSEGDEQVNSDDSDSAIVAPKRPRIEMASQSAATTSCSSTETDSVAHKKSRLSKASLTSRTRKSTATGNTRKREIKQKTAEIQGDSISELKTLPPSTSVQRIARAMSESPSKSPVLRLQRVRTKSPEGLRQSRTESFRGKSQNTDRDNADFTTEKEYS